MEKKDTKSTKGTQAPKQVGPAGPALRKAAEAETGGQGPPDQKMTKAKSVKTERGSTPAATREVVSAATSGPSGARLEESRGGADPGAGAPGSKKAGQIKVTLVKSTIGFNRKQAAVVRGLGLRGLHHTVDLLDTPAMRGMIHKVRHLVQVQ